MVEYLYNAIRAFAGSDITIEMEITDAEDKDITEGCKLNFRDEDKNLIKVYEGVYTAPAADAQNGIWTFTIPKEDTEGLSGRYWYFVMCYESALCFKQPLYLV